METFTHSGALSISTVPRTAAALVVAFVPCGPRRARLTAASARPDGSCQRGGLSSDNQTVAGAAVDKAVEILGADVERAVVAHRFAREGSVKGCFGEGGQGETVSLDLTSSPSGSGLGPRKPGECLSLSSGW